VPSTQVGPSPGAELLWGGGLKICSTKTEHLAPRSQAGHKSRGSGESHKSRIVVGPKTAGLEVPCADDLMPSGEWLPKTSWFKG
jgi:hypothetical protein